jgi:hypothetical protein
MMPDTCLTIALLHVSVIAVDVLVVVCSAELAGSN